MELKSRHEASGQNYLLLLLNMPPPCSAFIPHLLTIGRTEFILPQACPPKLCSWMQVLCLPALHLQLMLPVELLPQFCVMTGGPGREKLDEHIALLEIGGQPELYLNPWQFFISSQAPSLTVPMAFSHLGIFHRDSLLIGIIAPCWNSLNFGLRIRDQICFL